MLPNEKNTTVAPTGKKMSLSLMAFALQEAKILETAAKCPFVVFLLSLVV